MRRSAAVAVALTLASVSLPVLSQSSGTNLLRPSPVGIALTVGQWIAKDKKKVYYLQVQGEGYTYEEAKQQALRLAVDRAVGAVVLSETEVKNREVVRNEIIKYSSGFVEDYQVINQTNYNNVYRLTVDVWVSDSKIADRLLGGSKQDGQIDGQRHATQLESINNIYVSGDRQLQVVLDDFPRRSFVTKVGKSNLRINEDRSADLIVQWIAYWDHRYLEALAEALKNLKPKKPECGGHGDRAYPLEEKKIFVRSKKDPTSWGTMKQDCFYYDDPKYFDMVEKSLGQPLYLLGKFYGTGRVLIHTGCFSGVLNGMNNVNWTLINLKGHEFWYGSVAIPVNATSVRDLHSAEFEITTDRQRCAAGHSMY